MEEGKQFVIDKEADLAAHVAGLLGCTEPLTVEFLRVSFDNAKLFNKKQIDYGPRNISGFGMFGIIVRMNDKFERLKTLFGTGKRRKPKNESIMDSLRDVSNYSIIAVMIEEGKWPK